MPILLKKARRRKPLPKMDSKFRPLTVIIRRSDDGLTVSADSADWNFGADEIEQATAFGHAMARLLGGRVVADLDPKPHRRSAPPGKRRRRRKRVARGLAGAEALTAPSRGQARTPLGVVLDQMADEEAAP